MTRKLQEAIDVLSSLEEMPQATQKRVAERVLELVASVQQENETSVIGGTRWLNLSIEEKLADFDTWMSTKTEGIGLSDEAISRENIYD